MYGHGTLPRPHQGGYPPPQQQQYFQHPQQPPPQQYYNQQPTQFLQQQQLQQQTLLQQRIQQLDGQIQFLSTRYHDAMRVRNDVVQLLHATPSLYTMTTSPAQGAPPVLFIGGTLPIVYRGHSYNIPIQIVVPEGYPHSPPVCKVVPTDTMVLKSNHKHVSSTGVCYLPYLAGWQPNAFSLLGAAAELKAIFATDPPVRAKPSLGHSASLPTLGEPAGSRLAGGNSSQEVFQTWPAFNTQSAPGSSPATLTVSPPGYPLPPPVGLLSPPGSSPAFLPGQTGLRHTISPLASPPSSDQAVTYDLSTAHQMPPVPPPKPQHEGNEVNRLMLGQIGQRSGNLNKIAKGQPDADLTNPIVTALEAEDTNKDDAMYNLLKSLTEETTDLTTFLKNYRQLARDQFMARAKLIQARQGKLSNHS